MNRKDLQVLVRTRLAEAKALLRGGFPNGAYYLAGYAVECALKACIARGTRRYDFPDKRSVDASFTHNLKDLVKVAKLGSAHLEEVKKDPIFSDNWDLVEKWSERSRYQSSGSEMAERLMDAIDNRKHGVISWVKRYW